MNTFAATLWQWLIPTSLHIAVIVIVILLIQALAGRRLGANWRCALWVVVLLRLALPGFLQIPFSITNVTTSAETSKSAQTVTVRYDPPPLLTTQSPALQGRGPIN